MGTSLPSPRPSVWVLTNAPSPYQVELFSAITSAGGVELNVRFLRDSKEPGPPRNFPHHLCRTWLGLSSGDELRLHGSPIREAIFGQHDLFILSGLYTSVTFLCCAWFLHCRGKRWALWWERPRASDPRRSQSLLWRAIHGVKDSIRNWLLRSADLVIGIGTAAVNEYQAMGVSPKRLRMLPYSCDVSRFGQVASTVRDQERSQLGWSHRLILLFSGQMIPRKGVDVLLRAFERVAGRHADVALRLLGDGTDRQQLEALVPAHLKPRVRFEGHVPQPNLPAHFAAADLFVFPSRHDGWAVVINEACGAGLPIVATRQTGAAHDLVREGENGFVVDADDVDSLVDRLEWCILHRDQLPAMGQRSYELVQGISAQSSAVRFQQIISS